jgi:hypothetical protein
MSASALFLSYGVVKWSVCYVGPKNTAFQDVYKRYRWHFLVLKKEAARASETLSLI